MLCIPELGVEDLYVSSQPIERDCLLQKRGLVRARQLFI